jgi:hypothetical protein
MECFVCCDEKPENKFYKCDNIECKFNACVDCNKKYLLSSIQEQHCMGCKNVISYDTFLRVFDKSWVFGIYKKHKENLLIEIEKARFKEDIVEIAINNEIKEIDNTIQQEYRKYRESVRHLEERKREIRKPTNRISYMSNFKCPNDECSGFLDKNFKCGLCNECTCKSCYIIMEDKNTHQCNEEQVETFKKIKEDAKTCPKCGEFISKINGCDQMFCVKCGTSFSWKTGKIESGVVHNPHAHAFFQNNPQMAEMYRNNINGNQNGCRMNLPQFLIISDKVIPIKRAGVQSLHRTISEFRNYYRNSYTQKIENDMNNNINKDYRMKKINKQITDKKFKQMIHMRYKKHNYSKHVAVIIRSTFDIAELMFWEIANSSIDNLKSTNDKSNLELLYESNDLILNSIQDLIKETNKNIHDITLLFGYTSQLSLNSNMRGFPYRF